MAKRKSRFRPGVKVIIRETYNPYFGKRATLIDEYTGTSRKAWYVRCDHDGRQRAYYQKDLEVVVMSRFQKLVRAYIDGELNAQV